MENKNLVARFTSSTAGAILAIFCRTGKNTINTSVRLRQPGQKTQTGARTSFQPEQREEATAEWNRLQEEALGKGWVRKAGGGTRERKMPFTEIPAAPVAEETAGETAKAEPVVKAEIRQTSKKKSK